MSITTCTCCRNQFRWSWTEAFDKFGFNDGDGPVMTGAVVALLEREAYLVTAQPWGFHNVVITDIKTGGTSVIPQGTKIGYDDPRGYLPANIIELLDRELPEDREVQP